MFKLLFGFIAGILFSLATIMLACIGVDMANPSASEAPKRRAEPIRT